MRVGLLSWRSWKNVVASRTELVRHRRIHLFSPTARADGQSFTGLGARALLGWGDGGHQSARAPGGKMRVAPDLVVRGHNHC